MRLEPDSEHPHGLSDSEFDALFTTDRPVIFAYHGYLPDPPADYRRAITQHPRRGYKEEGRPRPPSTC